MSSVTSTLWQRLSGGPRERQALAFLRIATGLFFLYVGSQKFNNPDFPVLMVQKLQSWAATNPQLIYQAFLETVVLPNGQFFAKLVAYGELAVGLSYLSGCMIRYSAPAALFLNLNFLLATQHTGTAALGINLAFMLIHATLLWGRAGRCYGLDSFFPATSRKGRKASASSRSVKAVSKPSKASYGNNHKKLKAVQAKIERQTQSQKKAKPAKIAPRTADPPAPKAPKPVPAPQSKPISPRILDLRDS
jgi:uncharacterized membrane protein YphA (DoxX/SURF4 family)